jgi:hypothetical protein
MHDISAVNMASGTDHKIGNMNNPTTINFGPPVCNIASKPNGPCYPIHPHYQNVNIIIFKIKFKIIIWVNNYSYNILNYTFNN